MSKKKPKKTTRKRYSAEDKAKALELFDKALKSKPSSTWEQWNAILATTAKRVGVTPRTFKKWVEAANEADAAELRVLQEKKEAKAKVEADAKMSELREAGKLLTCPHCKRDDSEWYIRGGATIHWHIGRTIDGGVSPDGTIHPEEGVDWEMVEFNKKHELQCGSCCEYFDIPKGFDLGGW